MNTIRSTWYGWGVLCVAGGGAYYFAKKSINADRASRHENEMKKQARLHQLEASARMPKSPNGSSASRSKAKPSDMSATSDIKELDHAGSPSSEASEDVAPVGHAPATPEQRIREKSKYEAAEVFKSRKGDRFS